MMLICREFKSLGLKKNIIKKEKLMARRKTSRGCEDRPETAQDGEETQARGCRTAILMPPPVSRRIHCNLGVVPSVEFSRIIIKE